MDNWTAIGIVAAGLIVLLNLVNLVVGILDKIYKSKLKKHDESKSLDKAWKRIDTLGELVEPLSTLAHKSHETLEELLAQRRMSLPIELSKAKAVEMILEEHPESQRLVNMLEEFRKTKDAALASKVDGGNKS